MLRPMPPLHPRRSPRSQVKDLLVLALGYSCALSLLTLDITLPAATPPAGAPPHDAFVTGEAGGDDRDRRRVTAVRDRCAARAGAPAPANER